MKGKGEREKGEDDVDCAKAYPRLCVQEGECTGALMVTEGRWKSKI